MITWKEQLELRPHLRNINQWPPVDLSEMSDANVQGFNKRWTQVAAVLSGNSIRSTAKENCVSASNLSRLLTRCLGSREDTQPLLAYGLIPGIRIAGYSRKKPRPKGPNPKGFAGSFNSLLQDVSELAKYIDKLLLDDIRKTRTSERLTSLGLRKYILSFLYDRGWNVTQYPFNLKTLGRESIRRYFHKRRGELLAQTKAAHQAQSQRFEERPLRPYEHIELDEHRMDCMARGTLYLQTPWGESVRLARIWLIVAIDRASRAVLAYSFGYGSQPTQDDAMLCLHDLTIKRTLRPLSHLPVGYVDGAGFPSGTIEECEWATPNLISWDNHWSHSGKALLSFVHDTLGAVTNPGIPCLPIVRHLVESVFKRIAHLAHRLPSTTGSHPQDDIKETRKAYAKPPAVPIEALEELVEVTLANYNAKVVTSLHGRNPLQVIKQHISDGYRPLRIRPFNRQALMPFERMFPRVVRGNLQGDYRPRVNIGNFQYSGPSLRSAEVLGKQVFIKIHADARFATAFSMDGKEIGELTVWGPWAEYPHSLRFRDQILASGNEKSLDELVHDPLMRYLQKLGSEKKTPRSALEQHQVEKMIGPQSTKNRPVSQRKYRTPPWQARHR